MKRILILTTGMLVFSSIVNATCTKHIECTDIFTKEIINMQNIFKKAGETANQAVAGATAISSIDFGSLKKGETEGGAGVGTSKSYIGTDFAGAIGLKHGVTDSTAGIIKGWKSKRSHAIGMGVVHKF